MNESVIFTSSVSLYYCYNDNVQFLCIAPGPTMTVLYIPTKDLQQQWGSSSLAYTLNMCAHFKILNLSAQISISIESSSLRHLHYLSFEIIDTARTRWQHSQLLLPSAVAKKQKHFATKFSAKYNKYAAGTWLDVKPSNVPYNRCVPFCPWTGKRRANVR